MVHQCGRDDRDRGDKSMKGILILMAILGALMFALAVATSTPNDQQEYDAYMRWKERHKRHGKTD